MKGEYRVFNDPFDLKETNEILLNIQILLLSNCLLFNDLKEIVEKRVKNENRESPDLFDLLVHNDQQEVVLGIC